MLKKIVDKVKKQEMDRKDFLKLGAMAAVTVVGLKGVASLLNDANHSSSVASKPHKVQSQGYGGNAYGA